MRKAFAAIAIISILSSCGHKAATTTVSANKEEERSHTEDYVKVNYQVHRNLVGKKVIEGEVINIGKNLTYKSVTLRVSSTSDGNESSETFTVSDAIEPGGKAPFKYKPQGNPESIKVSIAEATAE